MRQEDCGPQTEDTAPQLICDAEGQPQYAVIPYDAFLRLKHRDQDLLDRALAERALGEEALPWPMAKRLLGGEASLKVWREHRGLTQKQLAAAVGARPAYISQLETGHKRPSLDLALALAKALDVTLDDLVSELPD